MDGSSSSEDHNNTTTGKNGAGSSDFPTLSEAATVILTPEELQNLRRNLTEEKIAHAKYLRAHPEIDVILRRAMRKLLMERPQDPVSVLLEYFAFADLHAALDTEDKMAEERAGQKSRRFIVASAAIACITTMVASYFTLERVRERQRRPEGVLQQQRGGQRVVIIGAGAAGCALAASLTSASPDLHVTVIEREKKHIFQAMVPLAHVGHRSYDLNTTGGVDFLRSPVTWNVTREASLVRGEVVRVDTLRGEVVVVMREGSSLPTVSEAKPKAAMEAAPLSSWLSPLLMWKRRTNNTYDEKLERRFPYDALVIACGAEQALGPLQRFLSPSQVDRYHIAVNPGVTRDCLAHLFRGTVLHVKVPPASFVDGEPMRYSSRQHDGVFVSSVNTIWRYLYYFNKLKLCPYIAVTADRQPSDAFPAAVNERITSFWRDRGVNIVTCSHLTHVDPQRCEATLYNYATRKQWVVPYKLLVLDLPLVAPAFIRASGLSDEPSAEGFVDVHPQTLQHRVHANIFALGDCAALPTVKSYGAVFAQVPVVSHNVRQQLKLMLRSAEKTEKGETNNVGANTRFARYNGYSSFHIIMTTWRAMWPEMLYGSSGSSSSSNENNKNTFDVAPLGLTNHHMWDNLAWVDVRGFLNAAYYQLFLYEVMFYFLFTRAAWHPPTWFSVPIFSEEDGMCVHAGLW